MAKSDAEKKKDFLKKHGLKRFNSCVIRTEGGKKGIHQKVRSMLKVQGRN